MAFMRMTAGAAFRPAGGLEGSPNAVPIRILMQQPSLAKYRIAVYGELCRRPGISLHVLHSASDGIPNESAEGFTAEGTNAWFLPWPLNRLEWHALPRRRLSREKFDLLILTWNIRHVSLLPHIIRARLRGIPVVVWGHGASKQERPMRRYLRWSLTRLASAVIVYSHAVADTLTRSGYNPARMFVALNTIDQRGIQAARAHWLARPAELATFRARHGLAKGPHLLFVSRLMPENRTEVLIRAAALLRKDFPDLQVTIVGTGRSEALLKAEVARLGLEGCVRFTGAIYADMDLAPWFLSADVFAYPSNIGLSLLHAFGFGVPVVVGRSQHLHGPEIDALRPGQNGAVFIHDDERDLARVLRALLADPEHLRAMGRAAHETATEEFTLKRMVDGIEAAVRFAAAQAVLQEIHAATSDGPAVAI
ncbi:N/A [soil metagenome]